MKIEHFEARARSSDLMFDWTNLLGVCLGEVETAQRPADRFHCDTHRGNLRPSAQELYVHPTRFPPDAGTRFSYTVAGEVRPAQQLDAEERGRVALTIERLNLNADRLKRNRAGVIHTLRADLARRGFTVGRLQELLAVAKTPEEGRLRPYVQVAVLYLGKKLRALGDSAE